MKHNNKYKSAVSCLLSSSIFAGSLLLTSQFANANIIAIVTESSASGSYFDQAAEGDGDGSVSFDNPQIAEGVGSRRFGSAGRFDSVSDVEGDSIFFKNGNASFGALASSSSRTVVDITFTNTGDEAVTPLLDSQIVPAGLGFYLTGCSGDDLVECTSSTDSFNSIETYEGFQGTPGSVVAESRFNFSVELGDFVLFSLTGSLSLVTNETSTGNTVVTEFSQIENFLTDFRKTSSEDSTKQVTYDWGATNFQVLFPEELLSGQSATLSYITEVHTSASSSCGSFGPDPCIISYGAFGDPIGRGGKTGTRTNTNSAPLIASFLSKGTTIDDEETIEGYEAGLFTMSASFQNGVLNYQAVSGPGIEVAEVNSPSMLGSFILSVLGFAVFRRKSQSVTK